MKGILKFFATWVLFGILIYIFTSIYVGVFDITLWEESTRHSLASAAGVGGFWFALIVAIITE